MADFKSNLGKAGYSPEELYFHEKNQELISKQRSRAHLQLIDGGKKESSAKPMAASGGTGRKAA